MKKLFLLFTIVLMVISTQLTALTVDSSDTFSAYLTVNAVSATLICTPTWDINGAKCATDTLTFNDSTAIDSFSDTWVRADQFIKVFPKANSIGWKLQVLVRNADTENYHGIYYYHNPMDTSGYHAGLVCPADSTATLSMKVCATSDSNALASAYHITGNSDSDANMGWKWLLDPVIQSYSSGFDNDYAAIIDQYDVADKVDSDWESRLDFAVYVVGALAAPYGTENLIIRLTHE